MYKDEKIFFAYDFHKRPANTAISNYLSVSYKIQKDWMEYFKLNNVTGLVTAGDYYDRGFTKNVDAVVSAVMMDAEMRHMLDFWDGIVGNHMYIGQNSNPELQISQPNSLIPSRFYHTKPLVNLDSNYRIINDTVQISYMHFKLSDKPSDYIARRKEGVKLHVAIYHTDHAFPNIASADTLDLLFKDVDVAIVGHEHKNYGILRHGKTTVYAFGASNNTSNDPNVIKPFAVHPILNVKADGTWDWEFHKQNLYVAEAGFKIREVVSVEKKEQKLAIKRLKNEVVSFEHFNQKGLTVEAKVFEGLIPYLRCGGYTEDDLNHMLSIVEKPDDIKKHVSFIRKRGQ